MTILTVSIPSDIEEFIDKEVNSGEYESKSQLVKDAIKKLRDEIIVNRILESSREARKGRVFRGDLRKIAKKFEGS